MKRMPYKPRALNPKELRFISEFPVDLNQTKAAIRAGYSKHTAVVQGSKLMAKEQIANAIQAALRKRADKNEITADRILNELAKHAFTNMADYMTVGPDGLPALNWANLTRDQAAALVEVTVDQLRQGKSGDDEEGEAPAPVVRVRFKLADKQAALITLGKHIGLFTDREPANNIPPEVVAKRDAIRQYLLEELAKRAHPIPQEPDRPTVIDQTGKKA